MACVAGVRIDRSLSFHLTTKITSDLEISLTWQLICRSLCGSSSFIHVLSDHSCSGGEVVQIQHRAQRSRDWCEEPPFLSVADQESEVLRERTRILESKLRRTGEITTATLREWFSERVVEIERRTGLIDYSKQMIQIAKAKGVHVI